MDLLGSSDIRVSVVIPCYNQGEYLRDAVGSVEAARGERVELVIVDDGSDDAATPGVLRELESRGHRVIHQPNAGLAAARNRGFRESSGDCLLPLDADNTIAPRYIEAALEVLDRDPKVGVVYGDAFYFGGRTGRWEVGPFDVERLAAGNYIDACAVFRRSLWEALGGYDEHMVHAGWEDWDFWLRVVESGRWSFAYVPEVLFRYRVRPASMLGAVEDSPERVRELIEYVARKHSGFLLPRFERIWGTLASSLASMRGSYEAACADAVARRALQTALEQELASIKTILAERDRELASVKEVLVARDEELASIKPVIAARDEELASVKYVLSARDEEVAALRAALAAQRASHDS